jgi:hypothetical protein
LLDFAGHPTNVGEYEGIRVSHHSLLSYGIHERGY